MVSFQNFRVLKLVIAQIFVFSLLLSPSSWGLAPKSEISALAKVIEKKQDKDVVTRKNTNPVPRPRLRLGKSITKRPEAIVQFTDVQGNRGVFAEFEKHDYVDHVDVAKAKKSPKERDEYWKRILGDDSFWEGADDYENLTDNSGQEYTKVGLQDENRAKNRYRDILPTDTYRVRLDLKKNQIAGVDDYINASYVLDVEGKASYIVTQAPKLETIGAFWRMIWENKTPVIGMMTQFVEKKEGKEPIELARYWPKETGAKVTYGPIEITMLDENNLVDGAVIQRTFQLRKKGTNEARRVDQYQYTAWPDHDGLVIYDTFFKYYELVQKARKDLGDSQDQFSVIHCSTGCGRTGVFLIYDQALRALKKGLPEGGTPKSVVRDILNIGRKSRYLVQNEGQYRFVLKALQKYFQNKLESENKPSVHSDCFRENVQSTEAMYSSQGNRPVPSALRKNIRKGLNQSMDKAVDFAPGINTVDKAFDFFKVDPKSEGSKLVEKLSKDMAKNFQKLSKMTSSKNQKKLSKRLNEESKKIQKQMDLAKGIVLMETIKEGLKTRNSEDECKKKAERMLVTLNILKKISKSFEDEEPLDSESIDLTLEDTVRMIKRYGDVLSTKKTGSKTNFEVETLSKEKGVFPTTKEGLRGLAVETVDQSFHEEEKSFEESFHVEALQKKGEKEFPEQSSYWEALLEELFTFWEDDIKDSSDVSKQGQENQGVFTRSKKLAEEILQDAKVILNVDDDFFGDREKEMLKEFVRAYFANFDKSASAIKSLDKAFAILEVPAGAGCKIVKELSEKIEKKELKGPKKTADKQEEFVAKLQKLGKKQILAKGVALMQALEVGLAKQKDLVPDAKKLLNEIKGNTDNLWGVINEVEKFKSISYSSLIKATLGLINRNLYVLSGKKTSSKTNFEVETLSKEKVTLPTTLKELKALKLEKLSDNRNVLMMDDLSNLGKVHKVEDWWFPFISTQNKKFPTMMKFVAEYESHKASWLNARSVANEESIKDAVDQNFKDVEPKYRPTALNAEAIFQSLVTMNCLELKQLRGEFYEYFEQLLNDPNKATIFALQQSLPLEGAEELRIILDLGGAVNKVAMKELVKGKRKILKELIESFLKEIPQDQESTSVLALAGTDATSRHQKLENIARMKSFELSA